MNGTVATKHIALGKTQYPFYPTGIPKCNLSKTMPKPNLIPKHNLCKYMPKPKRIPKLRLN